MTTNDDPNANIKIVVRTNGPYVTLGKIPLVKKIQVVSEFGEPLTWKKEGEIATDEGYCLCRCGQSRDLPFCDGTHNEVGFDGTENAPTSLSTERRIDYPGSTKIIIQFDVDMCSGSGFCGNQATTLAEMAEKTDDTQVRTQVIGMIEHCPSGALTYQFEGDEVDNEVDLPKQIAVTTEITSEGPIRGPFWVTGNIPIVRADGKPFEIRNRVTLCNCGRSHYKPLCDGSHRAYPTRK